MPLHTFFFYIKIYKNIYFFYLKNYWCSDNIVKTNIFFYFDVFLLKLLFCFCLPVIPTLARLWQNRKWATRLRETISRLGFKRISLNLYWLCEYKPRRCYRYMFRSDLLRRSEPSHGVRYGYNNNCR